MKKVILIIIVLIFTVLNSNSQGWQMLNSGTSSTLNSVFFINMNTGYVCGTAGTIIKTTNGGLNWILLNSTVAVTLKDILFADELTGYCSGDMGIIKTTNSGLSWNNVFVTQSNKLAFAEGTIIVGTQNSGIHRSSDGGQTWNSIYMTSTQVNGIYFNNSNTGQAMGNNGLQVRTTNGGVNWLIGGAWFPGTYNFGECYFSAEGTGNVTYSYNSGWPNYSSSYGIYKGTWSQGGSSWSMVYSNISASLPGMSFPTNDTGYTVGGSFSQSLILKTINGGASWEPQAFTVNYLLYDVYFLNTKTGYAAGRNGTIIKTTNGGVVDIVPLSSSIPDKFSLSQNYPNPFNPTTKIRFEISGSSVAQTFLSVYDLLGREFATLVNEELKPGTYEVDWNASNFPRGVYFYRLRAGSFTVTKKIVLVK